MYQNPEIWVHAYLHYIYYPCVSYPQAITWAKTDTTADHLKKQSNGTSTGNYMPDPSLQSHSGTLPCHVTVKTVFLSLFLRGMLLLQK